MVFDEETDPNGLLGETGSYSSKATFADDRFDAEEIWRGSELDRDFGGTIEVFENEDDCAAREEKIVGTVNDVGGTGDMYAYRYGNVLLRIGCELDPVQAAEYMDALIGGADETLCSKTGMAADDYVPLEKTGETTELCGIVFSVGKGWSIGRPVEDDDISMIYLQKGTDDSEQCYISELNGELDSAEAAEQVFKTLLESTETASTSTTVNIDGITAWRGSARSTDMDITWNYTLIPMEGGAVIACYFVSDDAPESSVADFEKSIHLTNEGLESAKVAAATMGIEYTEPETQESNQSADAEKGGDVESQKSSSEAKSEKSKEVQESKKADESSKAEETKPPLEDSFPVETAKRAATVALTNSLAYDVFADDHSSHDPSRYHSYSDRSGFYLELEKNGTWTEKDSSTWHVKNMRFGMPDVNTKVKASLDVRFDGTNYIVSNIKGMEAIPGKEEYGTNLKYIEKSKPDGFEALTVPPYLLD